MALTPAIAVELVADTVDSAALAARAVDAFDAIVVDDCNEAVAKTATVELAANVLEVVRAAVALATTVEFANVEVEVASAAVAATLIVAVELVADTVDSAAVELTPATDALVAVASIAATQIDAIAELCVPKKYWSAATSANGDRDDRVMRDTLSTELRSPKKLKGLHRSWQTPESKVQRRR